MIEGFFNPSFVCFICFFGLFSVLNIRILACRSPNLLTTSPSIPWGLLGKDKLAPFVPQSQIREGIHNEIPMPRLQFIESVKQYGCFFGFKNPFTVSILKTFPIFVRKYQDFLKSNRIRFSPHSTMMSLNLAGQSDSLSRYALPA